MTNLYGEFQTLGIDLRRHQLQKGLQAIEDTTIGTSTHLHTTGIDAELILLALELLVEHKTHITPLRRHLAQRQVGEQVVGSIAQLLVAGECCLYLERVVAIALHDREWLWDNIRRIQSICHKE